MKYNYNLQKKGIYFILPTLVTYGIFLIYPMFSAFNYSLYKWNLISEKKFIGIGNFIRLYGDKRFWNSFYTTIHFTIISSYNNCYRILFALILERNFKFKNFFQSSLFIPVVLTMVAIAIVWQFMFQSTVLLSLIFLDILGLISNGTSTKIIYMQ